MHLIKIIVNRNINIVEYAFPQIGCQTMFNSLSVECFQYISVLKVTCLCLFCFYCTRWGCLEVLSETEEERRAPSSGRWGGQLCPSHPWEGWHHPGRRPWRSTFVESAFCNAESTRILTFSASCNCPFALQTCCVTFFQQQ